MWHLPHGDALYSRMLRLFTTSTLDADDIHELGLKHVDRLQAEIMRIFAAEGVEAPTFLAGMQTLEREPRFYYPDTDEGRAQGRAASRCSGRRSPRTGSHPRKFASGCRAATPW